MTQRNNTQKYMPIVSLDINEATCLGAAMLAAVGCNEISSVKDAAKLWVRQNRGFEPSNKNVALYNQRYDIYKSMYDTIKPIGSKLAKLI